MFCIDSQLIPVRVKDSCPIESLRNTDVFITRASFWCQWDVPGPAFCVLDGYAYQIAWEHLESR